MTDETLWLHAFITSRLDCCNGLLANCSVAVRQRLGPTANTEQCCAPSLFRTSFQSRCATATPTTLRHWLLVDRRITYKLCVVMFDISRTRHSPCVLNWAVYSLQSASSASSTRNDIKRHASLTVRLLLQHWIAAYIRNIDSHSVFCRHLKTSSFTVCIDLTVTFIQFHFLSILLLCSVCCT